MTKPLREILISSFTADKLRSEGWEVIEQPSPSDIPFDIGTYQPDLLAHKGNQHQLIEVRQSSRFVVPEHIVEISAQVRKHAGWKWTLITGDQIDQLDDLLSWKDIEEGLNHVSLSRVPAMNQVYMLGMWTFVEAMIRRRLVEQFGPMVRLETRKVIDTLATEGMLSPQKAEKLHHYWSIRNEAAHGVGTPELTDVSFVEFLALAHQLFSEWAKPDELHPNP